MTYDADRLRGKHIPVTQGIGGGREIFYCQGCKGPNDTLITTWPCDVIHALDMMGSLTQDEPSAECDHAQRTKSFFFNARTDSLWFCHDCGESL